MPSLQIKITLLFFGFTFSILPSFALEGGQPVNAADYKGLVMLSYSSDRSFGVRTIPHNCTGIVLQPRRVLTTSQCVTVVDWGFGIIYYPEIGYLPANEIHVHPVETGVITGTDTYRGQYIIYVICCHISML